MLEIIEGLPSGVDGVRAVGTISRDDYVRVLDPLVHQAIDEGRRVRFVYQLGPEFEGFTPGAAWEDAKLGLSSLGSFDGCAVVTDVIWIRESTRLVGFFMPCPVRIFASNELDEAVGWLASLPESATVSHELNRETGVIVVEVRQALREQDFDDLASAADEWIETHGNLQGLVIHAREFPGWENFAGFLRHLRFVRDHHRHVNRIAFAVDTKLTNVLPAIAELFVQAEVKSFAFDELAIATAWAAGPASARAAAAAAAGATRA
ncbi:MAG TPA: STAS/SEC14 domain-containing protein [Candidatus Baltobacteraceae bacterium]|nr:STAS/SEC14 domain-containing protein [Candidatus Baltobacteraceae bacterium]